MSMTGWRYSRTGILVVVSCIALAVSGTAQRQTPHAPVCCAAKPAEKKSEKARAGSGVQRFAARAAALLELSPVNKGAWGLLVEDADTGKTLYELNADKYFVPASNMKLFTTALALAKLGPEYRFHTTVETRGVLSPEGMLAGDVVLIGRGDPNLSNRKFPFDLKEEFDGPPERVLAELADGLVSKGVREISGDIIGDDSYFPRERYPSGWEIDDMVWEYGAAISAIVVDDNTVTVTLAPGEKLGDPVTATIAPHTPDFALENDVVTAATGVKPDLTLTREPGANLVAVKGTLPAKSTPRKLVLAIQEPALHAAALLKSLLEERGVTVAGVARARHEREPAAENSTVLGQHDSVALRDAVKLVNKISQNLHSEMLLRTAAVEACRNASAAAASQECSLLTPEAIAKFPADFYAAAGIAADDVLQTDGSGLSRHDLVTPRAIVSLLRYAQKQTWFEVYYGSLPVAGEDGTLGERMKNPELIGRIHAKTGSVEHVRALSGFVYAASGRRLIFSFLSNNQGGKNHEAGDALDALCLAMVEELGAEGKPQRHAH
jgi:D-alanyl-D-alanine carboxypeptidase/D-alanyl-D-alanine-endopeptidase (penicillin-binding protein 4)